MFERIAVTMIMSKIVWFIVLSISTVILGISDFTCDTTRPLRGSDTTCKCVTANNIEWQLNDVTLSACTTTGICSPLPAGYGFQTNTSNPEKEYSLTVQGFDYNSCTVYSCTDLTTSQEQKITLNISAFDSTSPSVFVEPGNNQDGNIEITTECLFKESDITVEWYYVKKGSITEVPYTPDARFQTSTDCADTCNGEAAVRLNIGFTHTEDESDMTQTVKFGLKVYHKEDTSNFLDLKTGSEYDIKAPTVVGWLWWHITLIVIGSYSLGSFGIGVVVGLIVRKNTKTTIIVVEGDKVTLSCPLTERFTFPEWRGRPSLTTYTNLHDPSGAINPAAPAFERLQYASNKRDLILSDAVVSDSGDYKCSYPEQGDHTITLIVNRGERCKDHVSNNCECKCCACFNIKGLPSWYKILWLSIIGSPVAFGMWVVMKCCGQGKGDKASNVVNTGSHPDEKKKQRRPQPPPPFGANSPQREGSGSVVTGRDVEMQETYTPLKRSQSPDIHDGKRRGLSANFTDGHHPLVSIDIPAKRAGALESIPDSAREDVTKKKKKRKRRVETEDDQSD